MAILAYLGNVSGNAAAFPDMRIPMGCYIAGLVLCSLTFATMYLTQFFRFNELVKNSYANMPRRHMTWLVLTFSLAILSVVSFAVGSFYAVTLFS